MQVQQRLVELERENSEYYEAAVRQARQASSDSRLGWSYRRARTHTASPSADSVRSMPAQHLYWRQSSVSSLEPQHQEVRERGKGGGTLRVARLVSVPRLTRATHHVVKHWSVISAITKYTIVVHMHYISSAVLLACHNICGGCEIVCS